MLLAHVCALLSLYWANLVPVLTLAAMAAVVLGFRANLRPYLGNYGGRVQRIDFAAHHCLLSYGGRREQAQSATQRCRPLKTMPPQVVFFSEWVIVLRFDAWLHGVAMPIKQAAVTVRLLPDSLSAEDNRRLRVYLRFR